MPWVRIDDTMTFHHKIVVAGNAAVGAWVRLTAYSSAHGMDGKVPGSIARMVATVRDLEQAVRAGLLHAEGEDYQIHDFLHYNPSAEEVAERRSKRAESGRLGGKQSASKRSRKTEANASMIANAPLRMRKDSGEAKVNPVPARPDPSEENINNAHARVRGLETLAGKFDRICGVAMPDATTTMQAKELITGYAESTGRIFDECADELLTEFRDWVATWDGKHAPTPHLLVKHFDTVQGLARQGKINQSKSAMSRLTEKVMRDRGDA